ncbi:MAG: lipid A-modifier LpxR family protein [Pseudomonadota bacterium]
MGPKHLILAALIWLAATPFSWAEDRRIQGFSRILSNDILGDGKDRWRTGSYGLSMTYGRFEDRAPAEAFALMEYRIRAEILTPQNLALADPTPADRPYAGVIGLGAFTHMTRGDINLSFGAELNFVGPSTRLDDFQEWLHDGLGIQAPIAARSQLGDRVYPTIQGEVSRTIPLRNGILRPFAEAQAGLETYARVGVDWILGDNYGRNFFLRDTVTGHLMTNVRAGEGVSWGFVLGGDLAWVAHSNLLPDGRGLDAKKARGRVRAGLAYEGEQSTFFYGLTYLGPEFEGQPEGQVTGSISLRLRF